MNPWEQGSEFHWEDGDPDAADDPEQAFLAGVAPSRFSSGRAALLELLVALGRPRLWLPGYFCAEVVEFLRAAKLELAVYSDVPDRPVGAPVDAAPGDAVLVVDTFAARTPRSAAPLRSRGLVVVEDHTHDPTNAWAQTSDADWCLASLRKTLPLPDGALLWSPRGHAGPAEPALVDRLDGRKLAAMLLKRMYLHGQAIDKSVHRTLAIAGELAIAEAPGMSTLSANLWPGFALARRRARRAQNLAVLADALAGRLRMISGSHAILCFDSHADRERVRERLIANRVYPAILWPRVEWRDHEWPDQGSLSAEREFAERMLAIHVDARYGEADMRRVAALIRDQGQLGSSV
ncbi:hypothetical protein ACNOYE_31670 [Nannocystaceae bacterium ST9]